MDDADESSFLREQLKKLREQYEKPIPMILRCPKCGFGHLDLDEWATRPHKTHKCTNQSCGFEWKPCNRPTVGVESLDKETTES